MSPDGWQEANRMGAPSRGGLQAGEQVGYFHRKQAMRDHFPFELAWGWTASAACYLRATSRRKRSTETLTPMMYDPASSAALAR